MDLGEKGIDKFSPITFATNFVIAMVEDAFGSDLVVVRVS
jgi:hypothetical protein